MSKYVGRIITDQAPAGYSVFFNGTNGFLNLAAQSFTGDFTVEAWIYPTRLNDSGGSGQIFSYDVINIQFYTDSSGNLNYYNNSITTSATTAISLNSWQHVALCRSGSTTRIFVNGTLRATNASDSGTRAFSAIGQFASGGAYLFQGYISNVRWAATALYTANFTPPTQLLRIANTNLLTCNSPAIVDQSSNAFAITTNGNAAVSTFTPFAAYNPAPTSAFPLTPAPGVWTLDEAMQYTQQGVWPSPITNAIEDVFSTYLYTGTAATRTITNNIDLSTYGGMVWTKGRNYVVPAAIFDTVRGANQVLRTNSTNAQASPTDALTGFTSSGYTLGADVSDWGVNYSPSYNYVSWTFRKQAKFFDVVTYTGNGVNPRNISHNLNSSPGFVLVKNITTAGTEWCAWHQSLPTQGGFLNSTAAFSGGSSYMGATVTSTTFSLNSTNQYVNQSGQSYVMYLFAHNAGGFGAAGADNVISCGSFTTDGSGNASVNLGYEPQFIINKASVAGYSWEMGDSMRGLISFSTGNYSRQVKADLANAEGNYTGYVTSTGFEYRSGATNTTYIYIAIRRGPMRPPTTGTSVFSVLTRTGNGASNVAVTSGLTTDLSVIKNSNTVRFWDWEDRLRGNGNYISSNDSAAENNSANTVQFQTNNGVIVGFDSWVNANAQTYVNYGFRRAPGFFDEVCYTGTSAARTVTHNLNVVPELIIVKSRSALNNWTVYSTATGNTNALILNSTAAVSGPDPGDWNSTTPTASVFSLGGNGRVNASAATYVAYLFATVAGVSKVGSYTGTGALQTINCGFAAGARFVLIKRTDSTGDWYVYDSVRGLSSSTDPYLFFNTTAAEVTGTNYVDTASTGFQVTAAAPAGLNASGGTYIFLAIA